MTGGPTASTAASPATQARVRGPRQDFRALQAVNRRRSLVLAACLFVVMAGLGAALGASLGSLALGVGAGLVFALVQWLVARTAGPRMIMAASGAKPLQRTDDPQLVNIVEEVAIAAGIPCPTIWWIEDESPNAFATGFKPDDAAVAVTAGLRHKLTRDELQAVMAHELGHIRNGDSGYMVLMAVLVGSIAMLADVGLRSLRYGGARHSGGGKGKGGAVAVVLVVTLVLAIVAPLFSRLLQAAISRQREYLADATSVELTRLPESLASALRKLTDDPTPLRSANRATQHLYIVNPLRRAREGGGPLCSHPPLKERIRRIESMYVS